MLAGDLVGHLATVARQLPLLLMGKGRITTSKSFGLVTVGPPAELTCG